MANFSTQILNISNVNVLFDFSFSYTTTCKRLQQLAWEIPRNEKNVQYVERHSMIGQRGIGTCESTQVSLTLSAKPNKHLKTCSKLKSDN